MSTTPLSSAFLIGQRHFPSMEWRKQHLCNELMPLGLVPVGPCLTTRRSPLALLVFL